MMMCSMLYRPYNGDRQDCTTMQPHGRSKRWCCGLRHAQGPRLLHPWPLAAQALLYGDGGAILSILPLVQNVILRMLVPHESRHAFMIRDHHSCRRSAASARSFPSTSLARTSSREAPDLRLDDLRRCLGRDTLQGPSRLLQALLPAPA